MKSYSVSCILIGLFVQQILLTSAKPILCGGCDSGCGYGLGFGGCGPVPVSPPISFAPVPQPVPIRIPSYRPPSVTIPNIIVALLPPNQNKVVRPPPIVQPSPVVVPVPRPYPLPIREYGGDYGCSSGIGLGGGCRVGCGC